jgi:hypothetical protein
MKKIEKIVKKVFYGKIKDVGVVKGIGFFPVDEYYIDEHTYLFGFKLKTVRYWNHEDYVKKRIPKNDRVVIKGYNGKEVF